MASKNIKQLLTNPSPALTDFIYEVAGTTDYNITLQDIKDLFGIADVEPEQSETIAQNTTQYINIGNGLVYGAIEIKYLLKRGSRGYRTGKITLLVDNSNGNGVSVSDFWDVERQDGDDLGVNLDEGVLSSNTIQLKIVTDASDADDSIFNYQIVSKRSITVS